MTIWLQTGERDVAYMVFRYLIIDLQRAIKLYLDGVPTVGKQSENLICKKSLTLPKTAPASAVQKSPPQPHLHAI